MLEVRSNIGHEYADLQKSTSKLDPFQLKKKYIADIVFFPEVTHTSLQKRIIL
jgi:hypothetical protein